MVLTGSKEQWLQEGLEVLAELGAPGLRIDRLAGRIAMTKGSFYHHFDGMAGYKTELLAYFESRSTTRYIEAVEARQHLTPRQKLDHLMNLVLDSPNERGPLDVAVRAWAQQDQVVYQAQQRVDEARLVYLHGLFGEIGLAPEKSRDLASAIYAVLIGAGHMAPALDSSGLLRLWTLILDELLPRRS